MRNQQHRLVFLLPLCRRRQRRTIEPPLRTSTTNLTAADGAAVRAMGARRCPLNAEQRLGQLGRKPTRRLQSTRGRDVIQRPAARMITTPPHGGGEARGWGSTAVFSHLLSLSLVLSHQRQTSYSPAAAAAPRYPHLELGSLHSKEAGWRSGFGDFGPSQGERSPRNSAQGGLFKMLLADARPFLIEIPSRIAIQPC